MAPVVVVRPRDHAALVPIRDLVVSHAHYEKCDTAIPLDWAARIATAIQQEQLHLFVAMERNIPVGYATLTADIATWLASPYGHLDCLYVQEQHRGTGVGRLLLEAVVDQARTNGLSELQWQTPIWNNKAIQFYTHAGAVYESKERFTLTLGRASKTSATQGGSSGPAWSE